MLNLLYSGPKFFSMLEIIVFFGEPFMEYSQPFAEIIESSLSSWRAQCWEWDSIPAYGSICYGKDEIHGRSLALYMIQALSRAEYHRTVFTYKKTQEELKQDHPQYVEFLHTTFQCITLGYSEQEHVILSTST